MSNFSARLCQSLRDPNADPLGVSPRCPLQALVLKLHGHSRDWGEVEPFSGEVVWKGSSDPLPLLGCAWLARDFLHVFPAEAEQHFYCLNEFSCTAV